MIKYHASFMFFYEFCQVYLSWYDSRISQIQSVGSNCTLRQNQLCNMKTEMVGRDIFFRRRLIVL